MARLGLTPREFAALAGELPKNGIAWRAVISHLACADTPDHPLNEQQRSRFAAAARRMPGVHAIITGHDLPIRFGILPVSQDERERIYWRNAATLLKLS